MKTTTPRILINSGTLASGKSTQTGLYQEIDGFKILIGETTRPPRVDDLAGEFRHRTEEEFNAFGADALWDTTHGSPSRYTLLRSVVNHALGDIDPKTGKGHLYTRPLSPGSAGKLAVAFPGLVVVNYLPSPDPEELRERLIPRGKTPEELASRMATEERFLEIARSLTDVIHIAEGQTRQELHDEGLALMGLPPSQISTIAGH